MIYLLTTDPGLETVAARELLEADPSARVTCEPYGLPGRLRVETGRSDSILRLTTIHHVIEVRGERRARTIDEMRAALEASDFPELSRATSFRVTTGVSVPEPPSRGELARAAGGVLQRRYGTPVSLEQFEIQIRVDHHDGRLFCGVQLTRDSLGNRVRRREALRSALKPTVAAAMIRLVSAHRGPGRLIDPMCGAGTIPIEARRANPQLEIEASDWDEPTVAVAGRALEEHGLRLPVRHADARSLGTDHPGRFDYIVTDPPYGVRQARRTSLIRLYAALLPSFAEALAPGGRIAMLVVKYRTFLKALAGSSLRIVGEHPVDLGGLRLRVVVLEGTVAMNCGRLVRSERDQEGENS